MRFATEQLLETGRRRRCHHQAKGGRGKGRREKGSVLYMLRYTHKIQHRFKALPTDTFQVDGATHAPSHTQSFTHTHADVTLYLAAAHRHHARQRWRRYPTQNAVAEIIERTRMENGEWRMVTKLSVTHIEKEREKRQGGASGEGRRIYTH